MFLGLFLSRSFPYSTSFPVYCKLYAYAQSGSSGTLVRGSKGLKALRRAAGQSPALIRRATFQAFLVTPRPRERLPATHEEQTTNKTDKWARQ
ncbi:hypothetical protein FACS1894184_00010 [Clostridia bacterium]|nr:hypothetical protein FACS1894184_00010 [Clostridia bacterium]